MSLKLLILSLAFSLGMFGQEGNVTLARPFSTNEQPSSVVYSVEQTDNGYIYLGTDDGLFRYNGINYQQIPTGTNGLAVHNLESNGDLLVGLTFSKELIVLDDDGIRIFNEDDFAIEKKSRIEILGDTLIIQNEQAISIINLNNFEIIFQIESSLNQTRIWDVFKGQDEGIKVLHGKFLTCPLNGLFSEQYEKLVDKARLRELYFHNDHLVFDLYNYMFYKLENDEVNLTPVPWDMSFLENQKINHINVYKDEFIVISTFSGVYFIDKTGELRYHIMDGVPTAVANFDSENNIWIGTLNDGVYLVPELKSNFIEVKSFLEPKDKIHRTYVENNHLIIGTHQGWVLNYDFLNESWKRKKMGMDAEIQSLYYNDNRIFAYCERQYILSEDLDVLDVYLLTSIKDVLELEEGIYNATSSYLVFKDENEDTTRLFTGKWIRSLALSLNEDSIYANTDYGCFSLCRKTLGYTFIDDVRKYYTNHLYKASLYTVNDKVKVVSNNVVRELGLDFIPVDYFIENGVVYCWNKTKIKAYDLETLKEINSWERGFELIDKAILSCGFLKGQLFVIYEDIIQTLELQISWESKRPVLRLMNESNRAFELPYQGSKSFDFDVLFTINDRGTAYIKYRLPTIDPVWDTIKHNENGYSVILERLPSGNHNLELVAVNRIGIESEIMSIQLNVEYPYWQKWWFIAIAIIGIGLLILVIVWFRTNKIKKQNLKEMQIKRLEIQSLNSKLEALRSQMNPHFIFNTINTIQAQIMSKDSNNAYDSLNTFAKLIRSALEHSTRNFVSVKEDSEFVRNYISLEALRFNNQLTYEITVDESVLNRNPEIPSLFTQPFIENSIKHGLLHKTGGNKELKVNYSLEGDLLVIKIDDNGIGREQSAAINLENGKRNHNSYATGAIQERIDVLNSLNRQDVQVRVVDKTEGTLVLITIKLK